MDEYFKMTTGSLLICYYDEAHSLILFHISVHTISDPKMYKIDMYDEEGHCIDTSYYYKKETKILLDNWCVSQPLYYEIFEAKNIELNPDGALRDINLSLYEKLKSLTTKSSSSSSTTPSPRNGSIPSKDPKPLAPRSVISRTLTPRSSTSSSSKTPRKTSSTPATLRPEVEEMRQNANRFRHF